jgi:Deacetylases, including yeast histone deacetylase and acetoin utilization protein
MTPLIFHPIYSQLNLPVKHRFPIEKYQALKDRLVAEGVALTQFFTPRILDHEQIKGTLCPVYVQEFVDGTLSPAAMRRIGFPWSRQLVNRTLTATAGTILAGVLALEKGRAVNLTGGYHHAFYDYGSGFCIINDLFLCAINMLGHAGINRVLIVDCDVHQGDGTARLAQGRGDIFTLSIHGEKNFPFRKQLSDLDVALAKGTTDDEYLNALERSLRTAFDEFRPDAVIYDAGVDIHADDDLGHLAISRAGVLARDSLVFEYCERAGLPVAAVIGGGYQRDISALVEIHLCLFRAALKL